MHSVVLNLAKEIIMAFSEELQQELSASRRGQSHKVKVMSICIASVHETSLRRSGIEFYTLSRDITVLPAHPAFHPQAV